MPHPDGSPPPSFTTSRCRLVREKNRTKGERPNRFLSWYKQTQDDEEAARLVAVGAGRVTGAAAPVNKKVKDRQTVFASATVPQHNHFIRQCVQVIEATEGRV